MNKFLPLINLLMRIKFFRQRIVQVIMQPIRIQTMLDQVARNMKAQGYDAIATSVSQLTLVVHVELVPTRELMKGAVLKWQTPAIVRTAKR